MTSAKVSPRNDLRLVQVDAIDACPLQPRVNISVDLVRQLAASMRAGRHEPVLEVEPHEDDPDRFRLVCGEQRWRAAKEAGLSQVLVRVQPKLPHLERLTKQYEENRLRKELDGVEAAHCIVQAKALLDIQRAEELLAAAGVAFIRLEGRRIQRRDDFGAHLQELLGLLTEHQVHTVERDGRVAVRPLSSWHETETALGISETARKARVGLLRLPEDVQDDLRGLPLEHAVQISRLEDPTAQRELAEVAANLSHRQVRAAVAQYLQEPGAEIASLVGPKPSPSITFEGQLGRVADLCRQLLRLIANLRPRLDEDQRRRVADLLDQVTAANQDFRP
jgi:ParB/RepB/Spo0J family partition protein